jgi:chitinase
MIRHIFRVAVVGLLTACVSAPAATPTPIPTVAPTPTAIPSPTPVPVFNIVGYTTLGGMAAISQIQFDKLTHINFAFVVPEADGTFVDIGGATGLAMLVNAAHARNVKVLISVGGGGTDDRMEQMGADPAARATLVEGLLNYVEKYQLDGVDMDWEFPDPGASAENYTSLMQALSLPLHAQGKLLTAAVAALGPNADPISSEVLGEVDFLNVMVYDDDGPQHASYQYALDALDYWAGRGLPAAKTVLGVPFYAHPSYIPYRRLVQSDPAAAQNDVLEYNGLSVNYNGVPTIQRKTQLAQQRASGIMIWTLENDALDETSLLSAIYATAHGMTR